MVTQFRDLVESNRVLNISLPLPRKNEGLTGILMDKQSQGFGVEGLEGRLNGLVFFLCYLKIIQAFQEPQDLAVAEKLFVRCILKIKPNYY